MKFYLVNFLTKINKMINYTKINLKNKINFNKILNKITLIKINIKNKYKINSNNLKKILRILITLNNWNFKNKTLIIKKIKTTVTKI